MTNEDDIPLDSGFFPGFQFTDSILDQTGEHEIVMYFKVDDKEIVTEAFISSLPIWGNAKPKNLLIDNSRDTMDALFEKDSLKEEKKNDGYSRSPLLITTKIYKPINP